MGTSQIVTEDVVIKCDQSQHFWLLKIFCGAFIFSFQFVLYYCVLEIQKTSLINESHLELLSNTELFNCQSLKT